MTTRPFRARSRILSLLGDQLIGRDYLAVFELVKNSFDADASFSRVKVEGLDQGDPVITVCDDGEGMDEDIILNHWLELGNNHREIQRAKNQRTPKFGRLPLGEKGLGRIACHKLGRHIELVTRRKGSPEYSVTINWDDLLKEVYLDNTEVEVVKHPKPLVFEGKKHGTCLRISNLRRKEWARGEIRSLYRSITSICSPFEGAGDFVAELIVPEREGWLEDMFSVEDMVEHAPWRFSFTLDGDVFEWNYEFTAPPGWKKKLSGRKASSPTKGERLKLEHKPGGKSVVHDASMLEGIGPISGEFYAYDKDNKILKLYPQVQALKKFLDEQSGIRVYRDGVRVFNYGEPGDDWLGLDLRRVNRPAERLSRNIVVGGVHITLAGSSFTEEGLGLREKTNREGFDESACYARFRELVEAILAKFEIERFSDKDRLKKMLEGTKDTFEVPVEKPVAELRKRIEKTEYSGQLLPLLDKVERDYKEMKELLLRAGMSGLNLAIVIHEVHRGVLSLYEAIKRKMDPDELADQARRLVKVFETIAGLLRQKGGEKADIREVVQMAVEQVGGRRFERHHVKVQYDLPEEPPFIVNGAYDLILGALTNLIDNALYWMRVRYPEMDPKSEPVRRLYVGISDDLDEGRALIVADNGPGFDVDPEMLSEPFITRRPGGSGLGLYYASLAAQLCGGALVFPDPKDVELPDWVDGAVVALVFPEKKK